MKKNRALGKAHMHATVVFFGKWPMTRASPMHHSIFETHELCNDLFVTDTDPDQSLRDMLADGALVQIARRSGIHVELLALNAESHPIAMGFADICNDAHFLKSYEDVVSKLRQQPKEDNALRLVVIPDEPLRLANDRDETKSVAARSSVQQAVAITDALDKAFRILEASTQRSNCFFFHYGGSTSRNGTWESTTAVSAIIPKSRFPVMTPANISVLPTFVLGLFANVDSQDNDLHHHNGVAVTIDEEETGSIIRCICRLIVEDERYTVTRLLPPNGLVSLSKAFLTIEDANEWIIRDNQGVEDNLALSAEWLASAMPSRVLSSCLPAVRDVSRRRAPIGMAEVARPVSPRPVTPPPVAISRPTTPKPPTPPPEVDVTSSTQTTPRPLDVENIVPPTKRDLLQIVESMFGEQAVVPVADALKTLDDSPYTLVLGADNGVQVLPGALPPQLLDHLSNVVRVASLPLQSGNVTMLNNRHGLKIGQVRLDLESVVQHERIIVYRSLSKPNSTGLNARRTRLDVRNGVDADSYRGSVPRFARKMELARSLMHR